MKSKFTLWSVVLLLAGFIFVGCDNERTENASDFQTGIHKIVIQQSGDTDSFEVSVSIGAISMEMANWVHGAQLTVQTIS